VNRRKVWVMRRADVRGACRGSALVVVLLALLLLSAAAAATFTLVAADAMAAANERDARVAQYAAEAALERAADEVVRLSDWDLLLGGSVRSAAADGAPFGPRRLPNGGAIELEQVANLANCGAASGCSAASLSAATADRPWGSNNPRWRLFAYGPTPGASSSFSSYAVVMIADDPMESDGNPDRDGSPGSPGAGVILLRAEAHGPGGAKYVIEAAVSRFVAPNGAVAPRYLSWWPAG
jgi:hypothetical protein